MDRTETQTNKEKRIKEYNIQKMRWQMGYVLQQIALFPTMDVKQNIEVIPEMLGWSKKDRSEAVDRLLTQVKLDPEQYRHRMPKELSGGEQQRIGILRALAANPEIILMDEPFSALDPISRNQLQELIKELHQELNSTIVFVTHDMNEALLLGERICVMRDGKIVQLDTPEQIRKQPADAFVAQFFKNEQTDIMHRALSEWIDADHLYPTVTNQTTASFEFTENLAQAIKVLNKVDQLEIIQNGQTLGYLDNALLLSQLSLVLEQEEL